MTLDAGPRLIDDAHGQMHGVTEGGSADMSRVARDLQTEGPAVRTMNRLVKLSPEVVLGCTSASVTVLGGAAQESFTAAATDDAARRADQLQYELGQGPCLDAAAGQHLVHSGDLSTDDRWPRWGPAASDEVDAHSLICVALFTEERTFASLNLYAVERDAFDDDDHVAAQILAAHAALALAQTHTIDGLDIAVGSRGLIGQAQGILMERFDLDALSAFAVLRRLSSHTNTKLSAVATELVSTRRLPDDPV